MTNYQDRLITLSWMEDVDILSVTWSESVPYNTSEIEQSIDKVIETIKNYNCKKLLIDASEAHFLSDDELLRITLTDFGTKLSKTGIEKVARIITSDQTREARIQTIRTEVSFPFKIYDISNREQALHWLKHD